LEQSLYDPQTLDRSLQARHNDHFQIKRRFRNEQPVKRPFPDHKMRNLVTKMYKRFEMGRKSRPQIWIFKLPIFSHIDL
jgi:hypothetical protein